MASINVTVNSAHKARVLLFPTAPPTITTRTKKQLNMADSVVVMPKLGTCPTCSERTNMEDGILCRDCGAFLCDHPKCACSCDRIQKIAERTVLDILRNPKMYGLKRIGRTP
jgi:hypothetical protein